jgi:hypothetical protein
MIPYWPPQFFNVNNVGSTTLMDAAGEYQAVVFTAPQTGTIKQVHLRIATLTTAEDIHISLQNVDSEGKPDGTVDQFVVLASASLAANSHVASGNITVDGTGGGTKRSVTKGDKLALVYRFDSAVGSVAWTTGHLQNSGGGTNPNGLSSTNSGSTWSFLDRHPQMVLEYETTGVVPLPETFPFDTNSASSSFNTGTTPDEVGIKFQVPFKGGCIGVYFNGATTDIEVSIENAAKTVLAGPATGHADTTNSQRRLYLFDSAVTLDVDTDYYATWKPTTATSRTFRYFTIEDANFRRTLPNGVLSSYNTRTDGGSWTEDTLRIMPFALAFESLDDGAGGGGGETGRGSGPSFMGGALNSGQQRIF